MKASVSTTRDEAGEIEGVTGVVTVSDRQRHLGGQYPFASILGCADSRVSRGAICDLCLGDLFVARVADQGVDEK